ncbi:glycosyl hydrolase family 57 [Methylocaldum sp.]|uniref:glycosyl hydrolase family 57 n=1 Tax=Methylocaldum sp. TaxID=1969727 RepID=UPI002D283E10|nr:glycosyl hydrolase family 57 [Methylocaldum sp.]HYE37916.1 glycosyl hydrolase family 57 [Methylocaldum sp.]
MVVFSRFVAIDCPVSLVCGPSGKNPAFRIVFSADGEIPFPQVILHGRDSQQLIKGDGIQLGAEGTYVATVPAGLLEAGEIAVQVEGCRKADLARAGGDDWIKEFRTLRLASTPAAKPQVRVTMAGGAEIKVYFGIHKHMHQPYYNTTDRNYWDGEKDDIFGSRVGNYTDFIPAAIRQYIEGGLPHAGLSTSWSGSLMEQLGRCASENLCGGRFSNWNGALREMADAKTALGNARVAFSAFGFFHPLMPLIPARDIVRQIAWHRQIVRDAFGVDASRVLFPPETAFHVRMIPALIEAGITAVIYDSIHRFRACRDYPYAGIGEGMLPPNPADQANAPVDDWLQLRNIWAGSKISPSLLRPEYVAYEDADGHTYKLIAVPAERYIGNEDARGGFGALQYPDVLGQVYDRIVETGGYDPAHPPFFLLHSDGDNHGGGADSYYKHNTGQLVRWLREDPRFELTTIDDYLQQFPPDPAHAVYIEPGSWSGADNGDPQFMKWFSRYDQPYSPDLNSWAVLTAFQNIIHTLEDSEPGHPQLAETMRLLLTAETSCYWYWTGQEVWDRQVTNAANRGYGLVKSAVEQLIAAGRDRTGPTIFAPWVTPENPGGKRWGQGCLVDAPRQGTAHTFVFDVSGIKRVDLVLRAANGETTLPMRDHGPYPCETGAAVTAGYYTADLPVGAGDVRYYIEAEDCAGNIAQGTLERVGLA